MFQQVIGKTIWSLRNLPYYLNVMLIRCSKHKNKADLHVKSIQTNIDTIMHPIDTFVFTSKCRTNSLATGLASLPHCLHPLVLDCGKILHSVVAMWVSMLSSLKHCSTKDRTLCGEMYYYQINMVFVKVSHGMRKCHKYFFLKYKEGQLELMFGDRFCQLYLDVFTKCYLHVQVITREEVFLYYECYALYCYFKHPY